MTLPDLLIRSPDGSEPLARLDLRRFLYVGAVNHRAQLALQKIDRGELGEPKLERIELLLAIKGEIVIRLASGQSRLSVPHYIATLTHFLRFLDNNQKSFSLEQLEANYLEFSEHLFIAANKKPATLNIRSAYGRAATLSALFSPILNIPPSVRLVNRTRLKFSPTAKKAVNRTVEKQSLEATFTQGNFLVDLMAGLSIEVIHGPLPLTIPIRPGLVEQNQVQLHAGLLECGWLSTPKDKWTPSQKSRYAEMMRARQPARSIEGTKRWFLVNLRVQAEFLVFLAQTGMNFTQAKELQRGTLKYQPLGDSWQVRCYKRRKGGEVSFRIYKSYKPFLESYRSFISYFFPESESLFPLFDRYGKHESRSRSGLNSLVLIRSLLADHAIACISPSELRNTRVNWLLRRSGDADLTAEMAQHTRAVLRQQYERPSQQRAMIEVTQFWNKHDPIMQGDLTGSVIGSRCNSQPEATDDKPASVVEPNCINPSGCLWCRHHRDSDTEDYVWSLASMRHLKSIEAGITLTRETVPADRVLERLSDKLAWFQNSSPQRAQWVEEAQQRITEGDYHPNWSHIIEFLE